MNNQQIINRRWKKTERAFRSHLREVREVYRSIGDDSIDLIRSLNIRYEDLNRNVPAKVKRQVNRKIESWKKEGLLKDYFGYLVSKLKYTYSGVLEVLIYGLYMSGSKKLNTISNEIFLETAEDTYSQGLEGLNRKGKPLTWAMILPFLMIPSVNLTYEQYLIVLNETGSEEMYRQILEMLKQDLDKAEEKLNDLLKKQSNRILNVNGEKESGALVDTAIGIGNDAYVLAGGGKDQLVLFVAEMDERTTDMCRSLDHQIFHTKAWNTFTRYSDYYKGKHTFTWFGLERGLNMPPINDHFHWCRSTLTYIIENYKNMKNVLSDVMKNRTDPKPVTKAKGWNKDGVFYPLKEKEIFFKEDEIENNTKTADWFTEITGRPVELQPVVINPQKTKTSDFILKDTETKLELKNFDIDPKDYDPNKNYINEKLGTGYGQANDFILDITGTPFSVEKALQDLDETMGFPKRQFVNRVYLKNGYQLVGVFERKQK